MPLNALLLLLSGLLHATWNLAANRTAAGANFVLLSASLSGVLSAPAARWLWP